MKSEAKGVASNDPVQIVSKRVVVATEGSCGIVSNGEEACGLNLVDLLERRLPDVYAKVVYVDRKSVV